MGILLLIIGLTVGFGLGWLLHKSKTNISSDGTSSNSNQEEIGALKGRLEAAIENTKSKNSESKVFQKKKKPLSLKTLNLKRLTRT